MKPRVRLGVVGCGNVGLRVHLPACLELDEIEIVAAADPTPARLEAFRSQAGLGPEACYADADQLLALPDLDAVLVATPPRYRPAIAIDALRRGKHVLSEKPMALTPALAWAMVDAAREANCTLAVVHNYYFMPDYILVKDILDRGAIGQPYLVILNLLSVEDRPGAAEYQPVWRHDARVSGGGVLMDMLHVLYLLPWLMGQPIRSVSAVTDRRLATEGSVEDVALCRFAFDTGYGLINIAWANGPGGIEVMGTEGRLLLLYDAFGTGPFRRPEQLHVYRGNERLPIDLTLEPRSGVRPIWENFVRCVRGAESPLAAGEEGCAVLEAVIATYAAAARQTTVCLPLDRADPVFGRGVDALVV